MASTRPSFRISPPRKPLHERSDSHNNERASPTLRPVGEPEAHIYSTSPFPSLPSHVLHPKGGGRQGFVFEDDELGVSDDGPTRAPEHEIQAVAPLRIRKVKDIEVERDGNNGSQSRHSYHERSFVAAHAPTLPHRLSQPTPKELDVRNRLMSMKHPRASGESIGEEDIPLSSISRRGEAIPLSGISRRDEAIPLSSIPRREEALGSHRITQEFKLVPQPTTQTPIVTKSSDGSLSSAESTGTIIRTRPQPSRGSYSAFPIYPRPSSSKSNSSFSASLKPSSNKSEEDFFPGSPVSPISPILSSFSSPDARRTPSTAQTSQRYPSSQDGISIQYPAFRSPSASGSWADSSPAATGRPPRALNQNSGRWNPHLSAVPSEETEERNSGTMWLPDSRNTSVAQPSSPSSNTGMLPPPPALLTVTRDISDSTIRVVDEHEDEVTALPAMPVADGRGSYFQPGYPRRSLRDSRRNTLQPRPSSRGSFLRDSIPAWARLYYARPGTSSRPPTRASNSTDLSGGVSRPRSRPHRIPVPEREYDSMVITSAEGGAMVEDMHGQPQRKLSQVWSPHLWHDGGCLGKRRSMFVAPSIDEHASGAGMRRRNAQVWLFTLGFIFPFAWFIASVLPLPPKPQLSNANSKAPEHRRLSRLEVARDLEKSMGLAGAARYENARWWRNVNRGMSVLGVILLVAIIALAVVAVHMKNR